MCELKVRRDRSRRPHAGELTRALPTRAGPLAGRGPPCAPCDRQQHPGLCPPDASGTCGDDQDVSGRCQRPLGARNADMKDVNDTANGYVRKFVPSKRKIQILFTYVERSRNWPHRKISGFKK